MIYDATLPPSVGPHWRPAAERQYLTIQAALRATIQRAKASSVGVTPEVVAAFAALHMSTGDGEPITPAAHHWLWLRLMCDPAINRLLIVGTPESAKTTWVLAFCAAHIGFYPERSVIIAAVSGPVAEKRGLALRNIIESAAFAQTFPDVRPAAGMPWTAVEWSVAKDGKPHAGRLHPTVAAYGTGGSIGGSRAYLVIADDILDFDNTRTQHQRGVVDEWFHTSLLSRLVAQVGRAIVIGNAWHHDDTIARLRRSEAWATCHVPLLTEGPAVIAHLTYPDDYAGQPIGRATGAAEPVGAMA